MWLPTARSKLLQLRCQSSYRKDQGAEISLGPEMKSTGEVLGIAAFDEVTICIHWNRYQLTKEEEYHLYNQDSSKEEFLPS